MTGSKQVRRWRLFAKRQDAAIVTAVDGPWIPAGDSEPVVSLSDLQREIAAFERECARGRDSEMLARLRSRLGIELERKDLDG